MGQVERQGSASDVLVHRAAAQLRRLEPGTDSEPEGMNNLSSMVQRISGASILKIERLITELHALRDYLSSEAQRVQREITHYAHMNEAATKSTKIIAETLMRVKAAADPHRRRVS